MFQRSKISHRPLGPVLVLACVLSSCSSDDEFDWQNPRQDSLALRLHRHRVENERKNDAWFDRIMHHPVGHSGITTGYPEPR